MTKLAVVLSVVLPVLVALALGLYSKRTRLLKDEAIDGIKALVMQFMLPAVLLRAFYSTVFSSGLVAMAACMFAVCVVGYGLGLLLLGLIPKLERSLPFLTTGFEAGMMGYGLYAMLFPDHLQSFAMVDLGQVLFVFTLYSALLNKQKGITTKGTLIEMVKAPVFIAIVIGVLLSASGLGQKMIQSLAGAPIDAILSYISAPTGVLMLFVVGYQLELQQENLRAAAITVGIRTAIMVLLCPICILLMRPESSVFWAMILMFCLPAPFVLPIFSEDEAQRGYIATTLSVGTLLSVALFAVITILK